MARDGLLPSIFATVHPKFKTPHITTILTGVFVGGVAAFASIDEMVNLTNIGTLFAFVIVCAAVLIMRRTNPDAERPFRAPLYPFVPVAGILSCLLLMFSLPVENWYRLLVWMGIGFVLYFTYGYKHSHLRQQAEAAASAAAARRA